MQAGHPGARGIGLSSTDDHTPPRSWEIARATELARTCMDSDYENCEG